MTYVKSLIKAIKYPIVIALGLLIAGWIGDYPQYANMTVGALLIFLYDVIKHRCGIKQLP